MHLINEADADDSGEEEEVADDKGGDVVGGARHPVILSMISPTCSAHFEWSRTHFLKGGFKQPGISFRG